MTNARKIYNALQIEAVVTKKSYMRLYLTGFAASNGYVVSDKDGDIFFTDSRYTEAAERALAGTGIEVRLMDRRTPIDEYLKRYQTLAIPFAETLYPEYKRYADAGFTLVDSSEAFTQAMTIKSEEEIARIQAACDIAEAALQKLYGDLKEGITETDAAALLEYYMKKLGAEETSFNTICCFGAGGSEPHHVPGQTKLKFGDSVLIDFGCKVKGYCSDETRTFLFGDDKKHEDFKKAYQSVLKAQLKVLDTARAGMTGEEIDSIARDSLKEDGLDGYFTHSLGHGIGINIHEHPTIAQRSTMKIENGMVFSDEPGVYFPGEFGIRIEDSCTMQDGRVKSFMKSDKSLLIL